MADETSPEENETIGLKDFEAALTLRKQAFLLLRAQELSKLNKDMIRKGQFSYKNFICLDGDSTRMASQMAARRGVWELFQLTSDKIATLMPRIRIYRVRYADPSNDLTGVSEQLVFDDVVRADRGADGLSGNVGITNVRIDLNGGDFASANFADVELSFVLQGFTDLIEEHPSVQIGDLEERPVRLIDLLAPQNRLTSSGAYNPNHHIIKLELGWTVPDGDILPQDLKDNIPGMNTGFLLNLKGHTLDIREDGSVALDINYSGRLDQALINPASDILATPELQRLREARQLLTASIQRNKKLMDDAIDVLKREKGDAIVISEGETQSLNDLLSLRSNVGIGEVITETDTTAVSSGGSDQILPGLYVPSQTGGTEVKWKYKATFDEVADALSTADEEGATKILSMVSNTLVDKNGKFKTKEGQAAYIQLVTAKGASKANSDILAEVESRVAAAKTRKYAQLNERIYQKNRIFYFDVERSALGAAQQSINVFGATFFAGGGLQSTDQFREQARENVRNVRKLISTGQIKTVRDDTAIDNFQETVNQVAEDVQEASAIEREGGPEGFYQEKKSAAKEFFAEQNEQEAKRAKVSGEPEERSYGISSELERIEFVFLGDVIEAALDALYSVDTDNDAATPGEPSLMFRNSRMLLGNLHIFDGEETIEINMADLPVSTETLTTFFQENVVKKQREKYIFRDFLRDIIEQLLVASSRGLIFESDYSDFVEINHTAFTVPTDNNRDLFEPLAKGGRVFMSPYTIAKIKDSYLLSGDSQGDFVYYLFNSTAGTKSRFRGDPIEDFRNGVYHFYLGNERGIKISEKFKKVDAPDIVASNLVKAQQANEVNTFELLREPYDCQLKTIGNPLFFPGQYFYYDPTFGGPGTSIAKSEATAALIEDLLLGGYYLVLRVETNLGPGIHETTIHGKWEGLTGQASINAEKASQKETAEKAETEATQPLELTQEQIEAEIGVN